MDGPGPMRFGLQLWSQATGWPGFRDAACAADDAGWDSVWTWDHLLAIFGPWSSRSSRGWSVLAALAPITSRVRLGLMVGANTVRNPGVTAKLATTLDHLSGGRAVLGIGAAWFDREHEAFGIEFRGEPGTRLAWLDESVMLLRRLDGERVDPGGPRYTHGRDAICEADLLQPHLPMLIGGSGRRKTLRTVAEQRTPGIPRTIEEVRDSLSALTEHAAAVGRDLVSLEDHQLPDRPARHERHLQPDGRAHGPTAWSTWARVPHLAGTPDEVAEAIRPYRDLGFGTAMKSDAGAGYDHETIARIGEVANTLAR